MSGFCNLRIVPNIIFGNGSFNQTEEILEKNRVNKNFVFIFFVDNFFEGSSFKKRIPIKGNDLLFWIDVSDEPKTSYVDIITKKIKKNFCNNINFEELGIVGIGGGSTLDIAKAVSLMLTNEGSSSNYQGWDLVKTPGVYHLGIPTISGTGSEVSRTCVLTGPEKKLGINSDYTVFDQIILDPDLTKSVSKTQRFYTGMDCFIHCIESLNGSFLNEYSKAYGEKALDLCSDVFLGKSINENESLMIASLFGGMSIAYSQVGICHALSYGLSFVTGIHHGLGNCLIFNALEKFYPVGVLAFNDIIKIQRIELPKRVVFGLSKSEIDIMIDISLSLHPLWENALGKSWRKKVTRNELKSIYLSL